MPTTVVVIMQPYFLPYRNYYSLVSKADHFVIFDDVQFCRKWQQRNMILNPDGTTSWITVPVLSQRPARQHINEVRIYPQESWQDRVLGQIRRSYGVHPYFNYVFPELEQILRRKAERLIELTVPLLQWSASKAGIHLPEWYQASDIGCRNMGRTERLVYICQQLGATDYLSGTAAKAYLDEAPFKEAGIRVLWREGDYEEYPQLLSREFNHYVSVLDLLMNCGQESCHYLSYRE